MFGRERIISSGLCWRGACLQDGEMIRTDGAKEEEKQYEARAERFGAQFLQAFVDGHRRALTYP